MRAGQYFNKPKPLSQKLQELLDYVESAEGIGSNNKGLPKSFYVPNKKQYQEYYHLTCPNHTFFQRFYADSPPISGSKKQQSSTKKENAEQSNSNQPQKPQKKKRKQPQKTVAMKDEDMPSIGRCKFVVGKIVDISDHNNADSMFVEMIDIGEDKPRQICSGIKGKVTKQEMLNSYVVVFSNLKKAKLRGIDSNGMILAASNDDKSKLEIVRPPKGCTIGERVVLEDEDLSIYQPQKDIKSKKKKNAWIDIKDDLKVDGNSIACYKGRKFITSCGQLTVSSLTNAKIS